MPDIFVKLTHITNIANKWQKVNRRFLSNLLNIDL